MAPINLNRAAQYLLSAVSLAQRACERTKRMLMVAIARLQALIAIEGAAWI